MPVRPTGMQPCPECILGACHRLAPSSRSEESYSRCGVGFQPGLATRGGALLTTADGDEPRHHDFGPAGARVVVVGCMGART